MQELRDRDAWNGARAPADERGHYESWFLRANHPSRPLAFWIRYTSFSPRGRPDARLGELWAIWFDAERGSTLARKRSVAWAFCDFARDHLGVRLGDATLEDGRLLGSLEDLAWALDYTRPQPPLLLLPRSLYEGPFPTAKALVPAPMTVFTGELRVAGETIDVDGWVGSQCHNWGRRHTDQYAWGQVAGFDDGPEVFLECATARVRVGPFSTPWVTLVVVRDGSREWAVRNLWHGARARATLETGRWTFEARRGATTIAAEFEIPDAGFVGLRYGNPPGGEKICLNSKLARCRLELRDPSGVRRFETRHRAAFERLVDEAPDGVTLSI